uniref:FBA_2 domain-containing protein n=1 Tax=Caenorhabditis tropicalis TaxID=1561998 RepID=A0A1I7T496_9PELO
MFTFPVDMVRTLKDLSAEVVAEHIVEGKWISKSFELSSNLGDLIWKKISHPSLVLNRDLVLELVKKCNVTDVRGISTLSISDLKAVFGLEGIRRLELNTLIEPEEFIMKKPPPHWKGDVISTVAVLKSLLSPESQLTLKELEINSQMFWTCWRWMSAITPNLTSLELARCKIENHHFRDLCETFPHLEKLNISETDVTNLEPIKRLQHLEFLNINGLVIQKEEEIMSVF